MSFYIDVLKKYAVFGGRARQAEYWVFFLTNCVVTLGLTLLEASAGGPGVFASLYALAVLLPGIAVTARRLHDTGLSARWMLLALLPFVGALVLLVMLMRKGQAEDNRFGSDPLHSDGAKDDAGAQKRASGLKVAAFGTLGVVVLVGIATAGGESEGVTAMKGMAPVLGLLWGAPFGLAAVSGEPMGTRNGVCLGFALLGGLLAHQATQFFFQNIWASL